MRKVMLLLLIPLAFGFSAIPWGCGFISYTPAPGQIYLDNGTEFGPFNATGGIDEFCFRGSGPYIATYNGTEHAFMDIEEFSYYANFTVPLGSGVYADSSPVESYSGWCASMETEPSSIFVSPFRKGWCEARHGTYWAELGAEAGKIYVGFMPGKSPESAWMGMPSFFSSVLVGAVSSRMPINLDSCLPGSRTIFVVNKGNSISVECV